MIGSSLLSATPISVGITQFISRISLSSTPRVPGPVLGTIVARIDEMEGIRKRRRRKSRERHTKGNLTLRKVSQGGDGSVGKGACC